MHDINGALLLKASFLSALSFALVPSTIIWSSTNIWSDYKAAFTLIYILIVNILSANKIIYKWPHLYIKTGICISWPPALCLAPGPGPKFVFTGLGTKFVFISPGPKFVFTGPGLQFVFTGSDPQFVFTPNLYLLAQPGLSLHIPTWSPQFVFTGPGLWFVRTHAAKLICPQWCWII